eukprot:XP_022267532.1 uncharacterized protein LOC111092984 [Canis lupus familiaris]
MSRACGMGKPRHQQWVLLLPRCPGGPGMAGPVLGVTVRRREPQTFPPRQQRPGRGEAGAPLGVTVDVTGAGPPRCTQSLRVTLAGGSLVSSTSERPLDAGSPGDSAGTPAVSREGRPPARSGLRPPREELPRPTWGRAVLGGGHADLGTSSSDLLSHARAARSTEGGFFRLGELACDAEVGGWWFPCGPAGRAAPPAWGLLVFGEKRKRFRGGWGPRGRPE